MEWSSVSKPCEDVIKLLCARANGTVAPKRVVKTSASTSTSAGGTKRTRYVKRLISKAAQGYISEILRVSGQETNIKDIQGPALALVVAKVRPGFVQESFESSKAMAGAVSKGMAEQSGDVSQIVPGPLFPR
ncbi:BnaA01g23140D [Brassica napus]|uniref:(rape) hypothetical protein n=1 Tax=Brassica napus TaxID=3708 RepID=A0A078I7X7_BRANA|nr:unnamed protein product [Brassica napus]CDY46192.1 BnaA01g23140D [Brassica napus]